MLKGESIWMSWQSQDSVFVIMWQSSRSGGTYTELRKTEAGKDRLLRTLEFMGVDLKSVIVTEQEKVWKPDLKKNGKRVKARYEEKVEYIKKGDKTFLLSGGR